MASRQNYFHSESPTALVVFYFVDTCTSRDGILKIGLDVGVSVLMIDVVYAGVSRNSSTPSF